LILEKPLDPAGRTSVSVAIQGEAGSNSHMAALQAFTGNPLNLVPCNHSAEVFERLANGSASFAVLPIENSLHGAVFENYDLLLAGSAKILGELELHIQHNVIAAPGVRLTDVRRILSHPVALSQCRKWLRQHPQIEAQPFYDTAGSVKHVMATGAQDAAALAPALAAAEYGGEILVASVEDHAQNFTRFYVLSQDGGKRWQADSVPPNKASLIFSLEHRPGSLLSALEVFRQGGLNLTKIESRPVEGRPWEYVFVVDLRFEDEASFDRALVTVRERCQMIRLLGRYRAAAV
jgi:prephenate dehydratase